MINTCLKYLELKNPTTVLFIYHRFQMLIVLEKKRERICDRIILSHHEGRDNTTLDL